MKKIIDFWKSPMDAREMRAIYLSVAAIVIFAAGILVGGWIAPKGDAISGDREQAQKMMEDTADSLRAWREN